MRASSCSAIISRRTTASGFAGDPGARCGDAIEFVTPSGSREEKLIGAKKNDARLARTLRELRNEILRVVKNRE